MCDRYMHRFLYSVWLSLRLCVFFHFLHFCAIMFSFVSLFSNSDAGYKDVNLVLVLVLARVPI